MNRKDAPHKCGAITQMSDVASYSDVMTSFFERRYAPYRGARKLLARDAGVSPRTAEHWLAGKHLPKAEELLSLMANNNELARDIMRLVEGMKCVRSS